MEDPYLTSLQRDGFVVVPSIVSGDALTALQEAATRTAEMARRGDWPHVRTVGKQFPPWDRWDRSAADAAAASHGQDQPGIWGVQHLMRAGMPDAPTFIKSYFAAGGVLDVAKRLMGCTDDDDDLLMELYNMLVRPDYRDYELRWHRDDIAADATAAEELAKLMPEGELAPQRHAQWNLALWADASLVVVPGSHRRARTDAERAAAPFQESLPGMLVVQLQPGDAVFYNNNILHRGVYKTDVERATLHGSVGHAAGSRARARNVLQHGIGDWVASCDFSCLSEANGERARAEAMRARIVNLGRDVGDTGYTFAD